MGNNDSKETAPPVFVSPKGMMADLLLEGDFNSSSSSSVGGGGVTFGGVHEIVGDKDDDDDEEEEGEDVNEDEEAKKVTDKGGNEKGAVKVVVDVKTFSANFEKYIKLLDGVEGWLTRLVPAPSNSGPLIKRKDWFILFGNALYYFPEKPEDNSALKIKYCLGYILLHNRTDIILRRPLEFGFDIIDPDCMTMNQSFCCDSECDKLFWMLALRYHITKHSSYDSLFRHNVSKKFINSRVSRHLVQSLDDDGDFDGDGIADGSLDKWIRENEIREIAIALLQSLSDYSTLYNVFGGLFNVNKLTDKIVSSKQSDYWLFFVGGRLLCNQNVENILSGNPQKKFNIEDMTVEVVIDPKDKSESLILTIKSLNLTQKYKAKEDSPYVIQNLLTVIKEMKHMQRPKNIYIYDRFQEIEAEVTPIPLSANIIKSMQNHYFAKLFGDFSGSLKTFSKFMALPGDFIAKEHNFTYSVIILESGIVEVSKNNSPIGTIQGFFVFFDWTVFYPANHMCSIRAISKCQIISIDRKYFKNVIQKCVDVTKQEKVDGLKKVKLLENLSSDKIDRLSDLMIFKTYNDGELIIKEGDPGDTFYMLKKGTVVVMKSSLELARLKHPSAFGEMALIHNQPRAASIKAVGPVECYCISREGFLSNIGDLADAETESFGVSVLKKMDIFFGLSDAKLRLIARTLEKRKFGQHEYIITQGEVGDCFYVVTTGDVSVQINHVEVAILSAGQFFGEMALLNNDKRGATVIANTPVECLCIDKANFNSILGPLADKLRTKAEKRAAENKKMAGAKNTSALYDIIRRKPTVVDSSYNWCDLQPNQVLSNGQFSTVILAVEKSTGKNFILKAYGENEEKRYALTDQIEEEVKNQSTADSNFFVSLFNNTRVNGFIVLQLQYVNGENLSRLLYDHPKSLLGQSLIAGGVPMKTAVFYLANILYAVQYLHDLDIVHRNLNLENIMIDGGGYVKISDFSCSRKVVDSSRLYTICGKQEYLSPDMIQMNGYTFSVDIWSLGIIFYELLLRKTPFQGIHQNDTILNIMTSPPILDGLDEDCKHFLKGLLNKKMSLRLGLQRNGLSDIWKHPVIAAAGYTHDNVSDRSHHSPPLVLDDHDLGTDEEIGDSINLDFETCHDFVVLDGKK